MNLHRADKKPEWESVSPSKWTSLQKLAATTHGVGTLANAITLVGLLLVIGGVYELFTMQYWWAFALLAGGRLLDIADGLAAEATHTKSPLGEAFDASADKVGTLLTLVGLLVTGVAAWWVIALLVLPQVVIALTSFYKAHRNIRVHPSRAGKLSMLFAWLSIIGIVAAAALKGAVAMTLVVYVLIAVSLVLSAYALGHYLNAK